MRHVSHNRGPGRGCGGGSSGKRCSEMEWEPLAGTPGSPGAIFGGTQRSCQLPPALLTSLLPFLTPALVWVPLLFQVIPGILTLSTWWLCPAASRTIVGPQCLAGQDFLPPVEVTVVSSGTQQPEALSEPRAASAVTRQMLQDRALLLCSEDSEHRGSAIRNSGLGGTRRAGVACSREDAAPHAAGVSLRGDTDGRALGLTGPYVVALCHLCYNLGRCLADLCQALLYSQTLSHPHLILHSTDCALRFPTTPFRHYGQTSHVRMRPSHS